MEITVMKRIFVILQIAILLVISPAWAADKKSSINSEIKILQEENARLKAELEACQNSGKAYLKRNAVKPLN